MTVLDSLSDRFFLEVFINGVYPVDQGAGVVMDIGALALEYSIAVYPYAETIIALEPHPEHAKKIRSVLEKYPLPKIKFHELALASSTGKRQFGSLEDYGGSHIIDTGDFYVETISFEDLLKLHHLEEVDVLKIDIEGAEREILNDSFPYHRVHNIFMELHAGNQDIYTRLEKHYQVEAGKGGTIIARRRV